MDFPPSMESAPPMNLQTPPDQSPMTLREHLQGALAIMWQDRQLDQAEMLELQAFGESMRMLVEQRRSAGAMGAPQQGQPGGSVGGGSPEPYGTVQGAQQRPAHMSGGY